MTELTARDAPFYSPFFFLRCCCCCCSNRVSPTSMETVSRHFKKLHRKEKYWPNTNVTHHPNFYITLCLNWFPFFSRFDLITFEHPFEMEGKPLPGILEISIVPNFTAFYRILPDIQYSVRDEGHRPVRGHPRRGPPIDQ